MDKLNLKEYLEIIGSIFCESMAAMNEYNRNPMIMNMRFINK